MQCVNSITSSNSKASSFLLVTRKHSCWPSSWSASVMITAYASQRDPKAAFLFCRTMVRWGTDRPNHFINPHVLKSCSEVMESNGTPLFKRPWMTRLCSDIGVAKQMFDEMLERSVVCWRGVICGYARVGKIDSAIALFGSMLERDVAAWNDALIAGLFWEWCIWRKGAWNQAE